MDDLNPLFLFNSPYIQFGPTEEDPPLFSFQKGMSSFQKGEITFFLNESTTWFDKEISSEENFADF